MVRLGRATYSHEERNALSHTHFPAGAVQPPNLTRFSPNDGGGSNRRSGYVQRPHEVDVATRRWYKTLDRALSDSIWELANDFAGAPNLSHTTSGSKFSRERSLVIPIEALISRHRAIPSVETFARQVQRYSYCCYDMIHGVANASIAVDGDAIVVRDIWATMRRCRRT